MRRWPVVLACLLVSAAAGAFFAGRAVLQGQPPPPAVREEPPKELTSYRHVVKKVLPAVVSIEAKTITKTKQAGKRSPAADDPLVPEDFRKYFEVPDDSPYLGFGS